MPLLQKVLLYLVTTVTLRGILVMSINYWQSQKSRMSFNQCHCQKKSSLSTDCCQIKYTMSVTNVTIRKKNLVFQLTTVTKNIVSLKHYHCPKKSYMSVNSFHCQKKLVMPVKSPTQKNFTMPVNHDQTKSSMSV